MELPLPFYQQNCTNLHHHNSATVRHRVMGNNHGLNFVYFDEFAIKIWRVVGLLFFNSWQDELQQLEDWLEIQSLVLQLSNLFLNILLCWKTCLWRTVGEANAGWFVTWVWFASSTSWSSWNCDRELSALAYLVTIDDLKEMSHQHAVPAYCCCHCKNINNRGSGQL